MTPDEIREVILNSINQAHKNEGEGGASDTDIARNIYADLEVRRLLVKDVEPLAFTTRDMKDGRMVFASLEKAQIWVRHSLQDEGEVITPLFPR